MRLIDADALSKYTGYALSASGEFAKDTNVPITDVVSITREVNVVHGEIDVKNGTVTYHPDTSDVVEVVRCKDCRHLKVVMREPVYAVCEKNNHTFYLWQEDTRKHFCSWGE